MQRWPREELAAKEAEDGAEKVPPAADRLIARFPDDQGLFYLLTIWALDPKLWAGLEPWLRGFARQ